jgi:hypothetical protein
MAIGVAPYRSEHEPKVRAFNARMAASGASWKFYESAAPKWLPGGPGANLRREYFVAVDDSGDVRGAYCLKFQSFLCRGQATAIASVQGPVSEGLINQRFGLLAVQMIRDMLRRQPRLFVWGGSERLSDVLDRLGWRQFQTPFLIRFVKVNRFLRLNGVLRRSGRARTALDILAATGLAAIGVRLLQFGRRVVTGGRRAPLLDVNEVARFGPWADAVWQAAKHHYEFIAVRDCETMNSLLPASGWPEARILRMDDGAQTIGWAAVRDTQFLRDDRFGDLRVGAIIDSLALPGQERSVVRAAARFLERRGVDIVVTHYASSRWVAACKACGFFARAGRRPFIVSPALYETIQGVDVGALHLTALDGDGPHGF